MQFTKLDFWFGEKSMTTLLLVEDTPEKARAIQGRLGQINEFRTFHASGMDNALQSFRDHQPDVVLVDLYLDPLGGDTRTHPTGIEVVSAIRQLSREAVLILYSSAFGSSPQSESPDVYGAIADVVDAMWARNRIEFSGPSSLKQGIELLIRSRRKLLLSERPLTLDVDLRTRAAVETIGEHNIERLVRQTIPSSAHDKVRALTAGFSGAYVLDVESTVERSGGDTLRNVLKVGRDGPALGAELRARPELGSISGSQLVAASGDKVARSDGWSGIIMPTVRDHRLLSEYLLGKITSKSRSTLTKMIDSLFLAPAQRASRLTEHTNGAPALGFLLSYRFLSSVDDALKVIQGCSRVLDGSDIESARMLRDVVAASAVNGWNPLAAARPIAVLHGDMHSRNIFVEDDTAALAIDLAHRAQYPRTIDFAALEADLVLNEWDSEGGVCNDVGQVDAWCAEFAAGFPYNGHNSVGSIPHLTRIGFLLHLGRERVTSLSGMTANEYGEALAFQLLRFMRFPNLPLPKRVLAMRLVLLLLRRIGVVG